MTGSRPLSWRGSAAMASRRKTLSPQTTPYQTYQAQQSSFQRSPFSTEQIIATRRLPQCQRNPPATESAWVLKTGSSSNEGGQKPVSASFSCVRSAYVLPYFRFVYAEGDNSQVKIAFASHLVTVSGNGLAALLAALASQQVVRLIQPTENEAKFGVRGTGCRVAPGPGHDTHHRRRIQVERAHHMYSNLPKPLPTQNRVDKWRTGWQQYEPMCERKATKTDCFLAPKSDLRRSLRDGVLLFYYFLDSATASTVICARRHTDAQTDAFRCDRRTPASVGQLATQMNHARDWNLSGVHSAVAAGRQKLPNAFEILARCNAK